VYLWNTDQWKFAKGNSIQTDFYITNCAASDFNRNGKLDLLVQGKNLTNDNGENIIAWYIGDHVSLTFEEYLPPSYGQVIIMDADGDLYPDLFGQIQISNETYSRVFWINKEGKFSLETALDINPNEKLFVKHSNAFADISGDWLIY